MSVAAGSYRSDFHKAAVERKCSLKVEIQRDEGKDHSALLKEGVKCLVDVREIRARRVS